MNIYNPQEPYNQLPLLKADPLFSDQQVLEQCDAAREALQDLARALEQCVGLPTLLQPLLLPETLQFAFTENGPASFEQLLFTLAGDTSISTELNGSFRYQQALLEGRQIIRQRTLCTATAIQITRLLTGTDRWVRLEAGPPVRFATAADEPLYLPPNGEHLLRSRLGNWEVFIHDYTELDPLVRLAAGHFQLLAISPFLQGNIRCAHILSQLYLVDKKMINAPALNLSCYLLRYRAEYEQCFLDVLHQQRWRPWLNIILEAVKQQALQSAALTHDLSHLWQQLEEQTHQQLPATLRRPLLEQIFETPYCCIDLLTDYLLNDRPLITTSIETLCRLDILRPLQHGDKTYYSNWRLVERLQASLN